MKRKFSILLLATGLFLAGTTYIAKAGDEKPATQTEKKCDGKKETSKSCTKATDKKCDGKKTEGKTETKAKETEKK